MYSYDAHGYANNAFGATGNGERVYVTNVSWVVGEDLGPRTDIGFGTEDVTLGYNYGTNDNINIADTTGLTPVPGSWYSIISVYHKGSAQVYINGKLVVSKTGLGTLANLVTQSQIVIGAWWDGDVESLNGKIDNFRLYNRVLTPHEIAALSGAYQVTSNGQRPASSTGLGAGLR